MIFKYATFDRSRPKPATLAERVNDLHPGRGLAVKVFPALRRATLGA